MALLSGGGAGLWHSLIALVLFIIVVSGIG